MTELRTARLLLRRARTDDLEAMHAILSDRSAMRYWSSEPHDDIATTRAWIADMVEPTGPSDDFIVELDSRVIGKLGCWDLPHIGFIFHPDCWGTGIGREALAAYIDHAFAGPADHLLADVDPRNTASLALLHGRASTRRTGLRAPGSSAANGATASISGSIGRRRNDRTEARAPSFFPSNIGEQA